MRHSSVIKVTLTRPVPVELSYGIQRAVRDVLGPLRPGTTDNDINTIGTRIPSEQDGLNAAGSYACPQLFGDVEDWLLSHGLTPTHLDTLIPDFAINLGGWLAQRTYHFTTVADAVHFKLRWYGAE